MAHEVFISYSIKDRLLADALCHKLEEDEIRCWIAPRDISPGGSWAGEIADAIPHSQIMILVFSSNANASKQVLREVELAITNNLTVIPMKIEDVIPTGGMSYYLSTTHWIDAIGNKFDKRINTLSRKIQTMLGIDESKEKKPEPLTNKINYETEITSAKTLTKDNEIKSPKKTTHKKRNKKVLWITIPLAILIIGTLIVWGISELFPEINLLAKATATPPPTNWNTIPNMTANPQYSSDDIIPLKDVYAYTPEEFGYNMDKGVNVEDRALRNAIIENLNSTREIQITDETLTISDMFDLRYLNLVSKVEENANVWVDLLTDPEDLALEDIVISNPEAISSLNGLQYAKNLLVLHIDGYTIQDLSAIRSLESLRSLYLKTGKWPEPEAFGNLGNLYYLEIHGLINQETINAASWLPKLQILNLNYFSFHGISTDEFWSESENPITDLSPLTQLKYLNNLALDSLNLEDISALEDIITLVDLNMSANLISDITPLGGLSNLQNLRLYNNLITDVSPLKNLTNLNELNLEINSINNIEELVVLDGLQELYIDAATYESKKEELNELKYKGCAVYATKQPPEFYGYDPEDIVIVGNNEIEQGIRNNLALIGKEPDENITVDNMFNLETLIILHPEEDFDENLLNYWPEELNQYEIIYTDDTFDLEFLEYARNLKILYISNYEFADISAISSLGQLHIFGMPYNRISDLSPLSDLHYLRSVELMGNLITDISSLIDKKTVLKSIALSSNLISDLSPFEFSHFPYLNNICLWDNNITDLSPLSSITNLSEIIIGKNNIEDMSPLLILEGLMLLELDSNQADKFSDILNEMKNKGCNIQIHD